MKFETKKSESCACVVSLSVKAEAEEVKGIYGKVLNMFQRNGVIPGFRKGKVPLAVIKQKFAEQIQNECRQDCFREFYPKALEESKLSVIGIQDVKDFLFTPETGASFTAVVEVPPEFDLPKYQKLSIKKGDVAVEDKLVDENIERFRKAFAKYEDAKEGAVISDGDYVSIDYTGTLDDKAKTPIADVVPDNKVLGSGTDFWLQVEEGHFVPEILDALKGMKAGETKDAIKVKFPKDAAPEPLKNAKCLYSVTVKSFRVRQLPDDAAFVAAAKVESMDALKKETRTRLEKQAVEAELEDRKNQAIDLLLKKAEFDVPPSQAQRQAQSYLNDLATRAQYSGLPADYFEKNKDKIIADAQNNAIRQVRLSYILLGIAKAEKLEVSDDDVTAALQKIADNSNGSATLESLRKNLADKGQTELYREQIRAEKAIQFVLDAAK